MNPIAPTFPPTAVIQSTYQFVRPAPVQGSQNTRFPKLASPGANESDQITDFNCLLYLETCRPDRQLPASTAFDERHGNFVTADGYTMNEYPRDVTAAMRKYKQIEGSMCVKSELLFDKFLVPKFKPLVRQSEVTITSVEVDANRTNNKEAFKVSYCFAGNPKHSKPDDSYFDMKRKNVSDDVYKNWFNNNVAELKNENGWQWVSEENRIPKYGQEGTKFLFTRMLWLTVTGRSICNLQHFPGSNRVRMLGVTTMSFEMAEDRPLWLNKDEDKVAMTGYWFFDMYFKVGIGGRLEIDVVWPKELVKECSWVNRHGDRLRDVSTEDIKKDMYKMLREQIEKVKAHVGTIQNALKETTFVLAGAGYVSPLEISWWPTTADGDGSDGSL